MSPRARLVLALLVGLMLGLSLSMASRVPLNAARRR